MWNRGAALVVILGLAAGCGTASGGGDEPAKSTTKAADSASPTPTAAATPGSADEWCAQVLDNGNFSSIGMEVGSVEATLGPVANGATIYCAFDNSGSKFDVLASNLESEAEATKTITENGVSPAELINLDGLKTAWTFTESGAGAITYAAPNTVTSNVSFDEAGPVPSEEETRAFYARFLVAATRTPIPKG